MSTRYPGQKALWSFAAPAGGIVNNTAVTIKTAAGAGASNYVGSIDVMNDGAVATEIAIRDGAGGTVLWRGFLHANQPVPWSRTFDPPIKGSANTLLEIICLTTGTTTYPNVTGFSGPSQG